MGGLQVEPAPEIGGLQAGPIPGTFMHPGVLVALGVYAR
jgi:hypothetical protein